MKPKPSTSLTSVTIPNSVTFIGDSAFGGCASLESITIPNKVTKIGERPFWGCVSLVSIVSLNPTPPEIEKEDLGVNYETCTLKVPIYSQSAYRNHPAWSKFKNIEGVF